MQLRGGVALMRHQMEMKACQAQRWARLQSLHRCMQIARIQTERRGLPAHHQARALRAGHGDIHAQKHRHAAAGVRSDLRQPFEFAQAFHMHGAVGQGGCLGELGVEFSRSAKQQGRLWLLRMQPGQLATGGGLEAVHMGCQRAQDRWLCIGLGRIEQFALRRQLRTHPGRVRVQCGQIVDIRADRTIAAFAHPRQGSKHCRGIDLQAHAATCRCAAVRGMGLGSAV